MSLAHLHLFLLLLHALRLLGRGCSVCAVDGGASALTLARSDRGESFVSMTSELILYLGPARLSTSNTLVAHATCNTREVDLR